MDEKLEDEFAELAPPPRPIPPRPPRPSTIAWAIHSFGYRAGLPAQATFGSRLVFETSRRVLMTNMANEPVGSPGQLMITPIGATRAVFSVVADTPDVRARHRVVGVEVDIEGIRGGAVQ